MNGLELKLIRVGADLKGTDIANAMGVGLSRISHIERLRVVTPETQARYLAAVDMCLTKSTDGQGAA